MCRGGGQNIKQHLLHGLYIYEHQNLHNSSIYNITDENNVSDSIFVPSSLHPQKNLIYQVDCQVFHFNQ